MKVVKLEKYQKFDEFDRWITNEEGETHVVYYVEGKGVVEGTELKSSSGCIGLVNFEVHVTGPRVRSARQFCKYWQKTVGKGTPPGHGSKDERSERYVRVIGQASVDARVFDDFLRAYEAYQDELLGALGSAEFIDDSARQRAGKHGRDFYECVVEVASTVHPNYERALDARNRTLEELINRDFKPMIPQ